LTVNLLQAAEGVFFGALELGVSEPVSLVIRGGGTSEESELLKVSVTQFGGMLRLYPSRPMRDFYVGAGVMHGGASIVFPGFEVEASIVSFQPAVGFKVAMTPGLCFLVEGGLNVQMGSSSSLDAAAESAEVPGTAAGYALVEAGFNF
jgi:hypothetical protein